jgi:predicted nucleic acid-binding protein
LDSLGIVLAAKRRGWIVAARPVVERLLADGLYLSPSLAAEALLEVGE